MLCTRLLVLFLVATLSAIVEAEAPNIILVTVDTTRADHMGFLGREEGMAAQAVVLLVSRP